MPGDMLRSATPVQVGGPDVRALVENRAGSARTVRGSEAGGGVTLGASFSPCPPMTAPLYQTTDASLASFLLSQGHGPMSWRRLTPKKVLFRFEANEELHSLLR